MPTEPPRRNTIVWLFILFEGSLVPLSWGLGLLRGRPVADQVGWDPEDFGLGLAAAVPMLLAFWLCLRLPAAPLVRIRKLVEQHIRPLFAGSTPAELALLCLCAGVGEELLFRGVLQDALAGWLGVWEGLAVASVVFGLLHALTPAYAVLATLLGAYLGGLWVLRDNLLGPMLAHGVYDFVALLYVVHGPREMPG